MGFPYQNPLRPTRFNYFMFCWQYYHERTKDHRRSLVGLFSQLTITVPVIQECTTHKQSYFPVFSKVTEKILIGGAPCGTNPSHHIHPELKNVSVSVKV